MANHAYVFDCKIKPTYDVVKDLAEQFLKDTLQGKFVLSEEQESPDSDKYFWLALNDYDGVTFWCDDKKMEGIEPDNTSWEGPIVEFRHGHASQFMWWVDIALENWMAHKLQGKIVDDGCWETMEPDFNLKSNYDWWISLHFDTNRLPKKIFKQFYLYPEIAKDFISPTLLAKL